MEGILQRIADWINNKNQRLIIGISGHGASGKTTFASSLVKLLEQQEVNVINTDPYMIGGHLRKYTELDYVYNNAEHRYKMTACHPAAHNLSALERDMRMIRDGLDLYTIRTHYNREGRLISSQNQVTIVEGMSIAFTDPLLYDLTIYLYTDGETELSRRGIRDVAERGTDIQYLRQSHEERRIQYELFMHPHHCNFDIVLKNDNERVFIEKNNFTN